MDLLDDHALTGSSVVANNAMNRERQLTGPNSYHRELGFEPAAWLEARLARQPAVAWLDLCCGSGRALIQAGDLLGARATLVGVDLVDYFDPLPPDSPVSLICAPVATWAPDRAFDLITCVHGLHYVGDKLDALVRIARWLGPDGRFMADLDLASIRLTDGSAAGRPLATALRRCGFHYDSRRRRIELVGGREVTLAYEYVGADDRAGPNYTGQPAVDSYYRRAVRRST